MAGMRRATDAMKKGLAGLTATHKLLVGTLAVIVVMTLVLVSLLTAKPEMVELLPGAVAADVQRAQSSLNDAGVRSRSDTGRLLVSVGDLSRARAALAQAGAMPSDKATYFETLIARTDWMNSRQVNERNFYIALQNELSRTITGFRGVSKAAVQLSVPEPGGLGRGAKKPSASIAITSDSGGALAQGVVDGAARFVAGSIAGLSLEVVQVIDTAAGKPRTVTSDDNATSGMALEHAQRVEVLAREKLEGMLGYIPGVVVAVTASVDVTRSVSEIQEYMPLKAGSVQLEKKKVDTTNNSTQPSKGGGESGVSANQPADINGQTSGTGNAGKSETTSENTEYENNVGSKHEKIVDPKGQSTSVAVSVNVPRGYVLKLMKEASGAAAPAGGQAPAAPTEKEIADRFEKDVKPQVVAAIVPHVRTMVAQSTAKMDAKALADCITVSLVPGEIVEVAGPMQASLLGGLTTGSGGGGLLSLGGGLVDKVVLGVLSLAAMGMMISMVKKAGKKPETPSAEELVGLPPALETVGEVIGEAEEGETAMAGIEVGDEEMQAQKILEQVTEMVEKDPEGASKMIGRWVQVEE